MIEFKMPTGLAMSRRAYSAITLFLALQRMKPILFLLQFQLSGILIGKVPESSRRQPGSIMRSLFWGC